MEDNLIIRPFKNCDAEKIVSWLKDGETYFNWGGHLIGNYPLTAERLTDVYLYENGLCEEEDNFYPMTCVDNGEVVGHFIIRYLKGNPKLLRFGWVVVDNEKRGKHYGRRMLGEGLKYAFDTLKAEKVTLGVYEHNIRAYKCYLAVGFSSSSEFKDRIENIDGEEIKVVELEITKEGGRP